MSKEIYLLRNQVPIIPAVPLILLEHSDQMLSIVASRATIGSTGSALYLALSLPVVSLAFLVYSIMRPSTQDRISMNGRLISAAFLKIKLDDRPKPTRTPARFTGHIHRGKTTGLILRA